jgi:hypothetical protein
MRPVPPGTHQTTRYGSGDDPSGCLLQDELRGCDELRASGGDHRRRQRFGHAVAIAYDRGVQTFLISYLNEQENEDARETARYVEEARCCCVLVPGGLAETAHCRAIIDRAVSEFGRVDS